MRVTLAPGAGFCFGVRRAVELAEKTVARAAGPVATLGPLIHNPTVVQSLAKRGVRAVRTPEEAAGGTLIIRSHGAPPEVFAAAARLGLTVVDATCPFVRKAQRLARRLAEGGYQVVIVGDPEHPEIQAVAAGAGPALVAADAADLPASDLRPRVGVVCQTTMAPEPLARVAGALAPRCRELVVHNTICTATFDRQRAAAELAKKVEVMVVVGGRESANTARLAGICREIVPTYQIEGPEDLDPGWFRGVGEVGLAAGASTPVEQIEATRKYLQELTVEGRA